MLQENLSNYWVSNRLQSGEISSPVFVQNQFIEDVGQVAAVQFCRYYNAMELEVDDYRREDAMLKADIWFRENLGIACQDLVNASRMCVIKELV